MLNVLKTVRFRFIIRVAVWRVLWLRKEHYDISMQMGRILYFQNKKYCSNNHQQHSTSCRHQILMERIETPNIRSLF
jgi:hypothetical protein